MLVIMYQSLYTVSAMRGYVTGESEWSKGQKDAVFYLNRYHDTGHEDDYQHYLASIAVPLGDHQARLALNQEPPDIEAARQGFLQGKNHPDDVDGLIKLYVNLHDTLLMKEPIAHWVRGDDIILKIQALAEQLKANQLNGETKAESLELINNINQLNIELTPIEQDFSNTLGVISRKIKTWFYIATFALASVLLVLGIYFPVVWWILI
jgi:hypothetical protein